MIYVIFATSCNDNVIEDIDNNMTEYQKENKPRSNKENIYMEQTDHIAMLTRLVWFDKGSSKYSKHPKFTAFACYISFATFVQKTYVCTQRNKYLSSLLHSCGHASRYSSLVPISTQL